MYKEFEILTKQSHQPIVQSFCIKSLPHLRDLKYTQASLETCSGLVTQRKAQVTSTLCMTRAWCSLISCESYLMIAAVIAAVMTWLLDRRPLL